jgi:hypothetical protein
MQSHPVMSMDSVAERHAGPSTNASLVDIPG